MRKIKENGAAIMNNTRKVQIMKKRRLERELSWVKREFRDFTTLSDIELYNTERYVALHLGAGFI